MFSILIKVFEWAYFFIVKHKNPSVGLSFISITFILYFSQLAIMKNEDDVSNEDVY